MGYLKIQNLYKDPTILQFKNVYALEKVHGTSAHIQWRNGKLSFYSGGETHDKFVALFNKEALEDFFRTRYGDTENYIKIHGEAYGGKQQGMSKTYGPNLCFIVFDVCVNGMWLDVLSADKYACDLGLEFVPYSFVPTDEESLNHVRDMDSWVAMRRGMGEGHKAEGVVLRPPFEVRLNSGDRLIAKHKRAEFREHKSPRDLNIEPDKLKILEEAEAIAEEWCVPNRMEHVIQHLTINGVEPEMKDIPAIIKEMISDIYTEAKGEIVESKEVNRAISKKTVELYKKHLKGKLSEQFTR